MTILCSFLKVELCCDNSLFIPNSWPVPWQYYIRHQNARMKDGKVRGAWVWATEWCRQACWQHCLGEPGECPQRFLQGTAQWDMQDEWDQWTVRDSQARGEWCLVMDRVVDHWEQECYVFLQGQWTLMNLKELRRCKLWMWSVLTSERTARIILIFLNLK